MGNSEGEFMSITRRKSIIILSMAVIAVLSDGCHSGGNHSVLAEDISVQSDSNGMLHYDIETITLNLSKSIDENTLENSIHLYDKYGLLSDSFYTLKLNKDTSEIEIKLSDSFKLNHGWRYTIHISDTLKTTELQNFTTKKIEFVTKARSVLDEEYIANPSISKDRTKIIVISDLHIGGDDAISKGYSWTIENIDKIVSFLNEIKINTTVKELVIAGDLLDGWMIPYDENPAPDGTLAFFQMIRNSNSVKAIFDTLNEIANTGDIKVHYLNGNHDMLITQEMFNDSSMFENIIWHSDSDGLGVYWPQEHVAIEHGHRYDFSCAPDILSNSESILPYGYFISRLYTKNKLENKTLLESINIDLDIKKIEFELLWNTGTLVSGGNFYEPNTELVKMGTLKGWKDIIYDDAKEVFLSSGDTWEHRQVLNNVYYPKLGVLESSVIPLVDIVPGHTIGTMAGIAREEYFQFNRAKIVVFGHTHYAEIVKNLVTLENIYANSGTWIDEANNSGKNTCTYIELDLVQDTESDVNIVTSYIYNVDKNPTLIGTQYI